MKDFPKQNWFKIGVGIVAAIIAVSGFYYSKLTDLRCPDDYTNSEERIASFDKWTKEFYDNNPDASFADLSDARKQFYVDHDCQEALQRMEDFETGDADPEMMRNVYEAMDDVMGMKKFVSEEFGFSFEYSNSLIAEVYPEQPSWIVVYPVSKQKNQEEPMTVIIISAADDNLDMTAEEWLLGPNAGYVQNKDYHGDYHRIKIDGQDAVITDDDWVVVKTPDNTARLSFAYLVEEELGAEPLQQELETILKTFTFK